MYPVVGKAAVRHTLILSIALTALAGAAEAQSRPPANGQAAGLRYLTWAGKAEADVPESVASDRAAPAPPIAAQRPTPARSSTPRVIPHGGGAAAPVPTPTSPRSGLTPANAWMRPPAARTVEAPQPPPPSVPSPAPPPVPAARVQPAPPVAADPMAPRRDAPIFRLGAAAAPASTQDAAPQPVRQAAATSGPQARYYSLHRQNGRQPDAIAMPAPVYLEALPVELERTPQSEDLAEPPAAPTVLRDANGRVRPAPQTNIDDIQ